MSNYLDSQGDNDEAAETNAREVASSVSTERTTTTKKTESTDKFTKTSVAKPKYVEFL